MTFEQYINNPMGIKNSVISNREMYRQMYTDKLDTIMLRENGKVDYQLYKTKTDYFIYIKIPSEVIDNFYYDVVVQFVPPKGQAVGPERVLNRYEVKFFSNDPSFVFTFAHSFIKNGMFINDLKGRMSKEAVKQTAKERNPKNEIGYVKSIYFAYLLIKRKGLMSKVLYDSAPAYNSDNLSKLVMPADMKIHDRQVAAEEKAKKDKRFKNANKHNPNNIQSQSSEEDDSKFSIKRVKTTPITRTTSNSKRTVSSANTVKRTKVTKSIKRG